MVVLVQKLLYSCKSCCIGQCCCIRAKVLVFVQNWLYLGKSVCIRAKWLYSGKSGCVRVKVDVLRKVVVFGQE